MKNKFDIIDDSTGQNYDSTNLWCKLCKVSFTTQAALLRHITSKHETTQNTSAYCSICNRLFKTKWSLATHNSKYHRF